MYICANYPVALNIIFTGLQRPKNLNLPVIKVFLPMLQTSPGIPQKLNNHVADLLNLENELQPSVSRYIDNCFRRIGEYEATINATLLKHAVIDSPLRIRVGSELEFYTIAGEKSFGRRLRQLHRADDSSSKNGEPGSFERELAKNDSFMPKQAQCVELDKAFFTRLETAESVRVVPETAFNLQIATERFYPRIGQDAEISNIAIFQPEIVSPPRTLLGLGTWLATVGQRIIDKSKDYGLVRSEIITHFENMSSSGLHFHLSALGSKDGKEVNIMQRDCFPTEKGNQKRNPAAISQLGFHVAHAINAFLKDNIYLYAPTSRAYERFTDLHAVGTSFIGFSPRRVRLDQGSAIFRGSGRETYRENDEKGKADTGPLRIELRVPDVGCIGHPNKRLYQEQLTAPYDVVESLAYMLMSGVKDWEQARIKALKGNPGVTKTEAALYETRYEFPRSAGEAARNMLESAKKADGFLTPKRARLIAARGFRQQEIDDLDRSPKFPRGQTHDRSEQLQNPNPFSE
jgi:hypothetical protein